MATTHSASVKVLGVNLYTQTVHSPISPGSPASETKQVTCAAVQVEVQADPSNSGAFTNTASQNFNLNMTDVVQPFDLQVGGLYTLSLTPAA